MMLKNVLEDHLLMLSRESSPRHIGELLFASVLNRSVAWVLAYSDSIVSAEECEKFTKLCKRYQKGEPLAYLIGKQEFYGLDFAVNKHVLIPRPETEYLVETAIGFVQKKCSANRVKILDIGTGSGNIAISLAKNLNNAHVTAVDVSPEALKVAHLNAKMHAVNDRVELVEGDLLSNFFEQNYDVITANLPYIGETVHRYVDKNTFDYEPHLALFGGSDGLDLYKKMFQQISSKKIDFSFMIGEFCFGQRADMGKLLNTFFDHRFSIEKDFAGIDRYFVVDFS